MKELISRQVVLAEVAAWLEGLQDKHLIAILEEIPIENDGLSWISVKERLPETRDWVLVIGEFVPEGGWFVPHIAEYFLGMWRLDVDECSSPEERSIKVTHWMPLPEPPKEE